MPTMTGISGAITISLLLFITCGSLCGCGKTDTHLGTDAMPLESAIATCLDRSGASTAASASDLVFLEEAESDQAVQKLGLFYDGKTSQIVREWAAVTFEREPPEWIIWFGQPSDSDLSPKELAETHSPGAFVRFIKHPGPSQRKQTMQCLNFGNGSGKVHFHSIHPE